MITPFPAEPPSTVDELDELMTRPTNRVRESLSSNAGNVVVLGAGGKMGFHLCGMLRHALNDVGRADDAVIAVSRFGSAAQEAPFSRYGIEVLRADLTDEAQVKDLPAAAAAFFLAGVKFGTANNSGLLHLMNEVVPARVAERYRDARIVALSTGCVYSFVRPESGGSKETDPVEPVGEYALSCLGRERAFTEASKRNGTPVTLIRLNYSIDLRYGVLVDIAGKVLSGEPVDVSTGYANVIWQRDAIAHTIQSLEYAASPPFILNVTGPEILRIRDLAEEFGRRFHLSVKVIGDEKPEAWLNDASLSHRLFGRPEMPVETMMDWIAGWLRGGGETLGKPTHFENREGKF